MPEQTELSDCCFSGHLHSGTPKGRETVVGGRKCYEAGEQKDKKNTIVFLQDVWGWAIPNTRLLADEYAANGFYVYLPDLVDDDNIPEWVLRVAAPKNRELDNKSLTEKVKDTFLQGAEYGPWLIRHREAVTRPIIDEFLAALKQDSEIKALFSVGFCWGARYSILYARDGAFDAVVANHPSFLAVPSDLQGTSRPIAVAVGDKDTIMSIDKVKELEAELDKLPQETQVKIYPDAIHGFTNRGDLENDKEHRQKEEALNQAIAWFRKFSVA